MSNQRKLWARKMSCGHIRNTDVNFMAGIFKEPEVGTNGYCRECHGEREIIEVNEVILKKC